jgi:pimeloyl-ACP methyl ester carboxylesterase
MKRISFFTGQGCAFFKHHPKLATWRQHFHFIDLLNIPIDRQVEEQEIQMQNDDPTVVVAHSGGVNKALEYAIRHSGTVKKVILLSPAAVPGSITPFYMNVLCSLKPRKVLLPILMGKEFDLPQDYKDQLLFNNLDVNARREFSAETGKWCGHVIKEMMLKSYWFSPNWKQLLPTTEILVASGDDDNVIHWSLAQRVACKLNAKLVRLKEASHMFMLEEHSGLYLDIVRKLVQAPETCLA